jgi:hypothetical protein
MGMISRCKNVLVAALMVLAMSALTARAAMPPTPSNLSAAAGDGNVSLSWSPVDGNPTEYTVKRANSSGGSYTAIYSGPATAASDTSVGNFRTYYYVVSASNADGESANSSEVTAMPANNCGAEATQCLGAGAACVLPAYCASQEMKAGAFLVRLIANSSAAFNLPVFPSTANNKIEVGTVNISGFQAIPSGTNTAITLFQQPGALIVASNDDYGADVRSYLSYTNAVANPGDLVSYSIVVICREPSGCLGQVAFRISDLAHTSCANPKYVPKGTVCRAASDKCDIAETCTGTSPDCPADALYDDHHVCRPSSDLCDIEERCTGASKACPQDRALPAGMVCRGSAGGCDPAETCDGTSKACPVDALAASGVVCRPALGPKDVDHICSGSSPICPADTGTCACGP